MIKLLALLALLSTAAQAGLPPTTSKGQNDASATVTFNLQAPNSQITKINGTTALIETGNGNYVSDPGVESSGVAFYSKGHVTLTNGIPSGVPTFGSGASGTLSIAASNVSPIAGKYSLTYGDSAATTAGDFVATNAFPIDQEGQAKPLQLKISYQASVNPTNGNFSGTSSNSFGVALYDVTNSAWLSCSGNFNVVQSSGVGVATGNCQTAITTASARLVFYNVSASSGAITMKLDNFFYGPQITAQGAAITDWQSYTPTYTNGGTATFTTLRSQYRRVGDSIEVSGSVSITASGSGSSIFSVSMPTGFTPDTVKLGSSVESTLGYARYYNGTNTLSYGPDFNTAVSSSALFFSQATNAAAANLKGSDLVNGGALNFIAFIPITGQSSNTVMSNDTDTRVVTAQASGAPSSTTSGNIIIWPTAQFDTHGAYSVSTGQFTAPVSGYYRVDMFLFNSNSAVSYFFYVNGVQGLSIGSALSGSATMRQNMTGVVKLNAGDLLTIRPDGTTGTWNGNSNITFTRISGPATIAASETISAKYWASAGTTSTTTQPIQFDSKVYDDHGAVTTGSSWKFSAPGPGKYKYSLYVNFASGTNATYIVVYKNGSAYEFIGLDPNVSTNAFNGAGELSLNAGDYIDFRCNTSSATSGNASQANVNASHVEITRTGN